MIVTHEGDGDIKMRKQETDGAADPQRDWGQSKREGWSTFPSSKEGSSLPSLWAGCGEDIVVVKSLMHIGDVTKPRFRFFSNPKEMSLPHMYPIFSAVKKYIFFDCREVEPCKHMFLSLGTLSTLDN